MSLTHRAYRHADLPRVADLLESRLAASLPWNLTASDLRHVLTRPSTNAEQYGHLWEDPSGQFLAFAFVWLPWDNLYLLVHPDHDPERVAHPTLCTAIITGPKPPPPRLPATGASHSNSASAPATTNPP